ncbi:hypothetical protein C8Q76DRAFT_605694, partial [Earliella scabrosa]
FTVALTDDFSLDSLILHGPRGGWALDSSWRNKNENRAAVTFLITVNETRHAVPGSVLLSANVRTETLKQYLAETRSKLKARAQAILAEVELKKHALEVVQGTFEPSHYMIDKCYAELRAIRDADPDALIRLCQFHTVQAIIRLDTDKGDRGSPMRIPLTVKFEVVYFFRVLQRCRTWDEWPTARDAFLRRTSADARKQAQWVFLREYFETNWFTEEWIPCWTDIGLPSDQTRDGPWNTNNWIERAFRTFDAIFLDHRANKRIDRLAIIILNDFLPFFRVWNPDDESETRAILELNHRAYHLWSGDLVSPNPDGSFTVRAPA